MSSRADAYAAFYRESRARLLHQVYAFCGDPEVAQRALADAFVSAGHHWRKLSAEPDKDAWMRERAFKASTRSINRAQKPWYVRALSTADEHRPLLAALQSLPATDRQLLLLVHLARLDVRAAAREAGMTDDAARRSLDRSTDALAEHGLDASIIGIRGSLEDLRRDLADEPVDRASRLRREGNRRRRSHMGLVALCSLALVIGAGAVTVARPEQVSSSTLDPTPPTPSQPAQSIAPPRPGETLSAADLAPISAVRMVKAGSPWTDEETSKDFGASSPYDPCLTAVPVDRHGQHFFVRTFRAGSDGDTTTATQAMEVSASITAADRTYDRLVRMFATCAAPSHQVRSFAVAQGVGDAASVIGLRYVGPSGGLRDQTVSVSQSGMVTSVWVFDAPTVRAIPAMPVLRLAAASVQKVCDKSMGGCVRRPFHLLSQLPPDSGRAHGFLTALDLPVFAGLTEPWVATSPSAVHSNPAATACDQADFVAARARRLEARSFVVPSNRSVTKIFGMTETRGEFASPQAAGKFVAEVTTNVRRCHDRQLTLRLRSSDTVPVTQGVAHLWTIRQATSQSRALTFRVALFRVGSSVGQVTFTPSGSYDLSPAEMVALVRRAALRASQEG